MIRSISTVQAQDEGKMSNQTVSIVKVQGNVKGAILEAIGRIGGIVLSPASKVAIKPNLCTFMGPETGATTDVEIIEAIVELINREESSCRIFIVESRSLSGKATEKFRRLGYADLEVKYDNVKLVDLDRDETYNVLFSENERLKIVKVPETLMMSNYLISVAKLKTSDQQKISCILKNQFGCIPGKKEGYHPWLSQAIVDASYVFRPDLCVIDGIFSMEGKGPTGGNPKRMNIIIAGKNPVATDTVAARVMGFDPKTVPHLKRAAKREFSLKGDVDVVGENIDNIREKFLFIPSYAYLTLRLSDYIQRMAGRLERFGELIFLAGAFLSNAREYWPMLRRLSLPEIRREIQERRIK